MVPQTMERNGDMLTMGGHLEWNGDIAIDTAGETGAWNGMETWCSRWNGMETPVGSAQRSVQ